MELSEFKQHILPLKDRLFRVALCIVRNREDAEDIVQEVLLKVWSGQTSIANVSKPAAYCMVMAKNMALDKLRHPTHKIPHLSVEPQDAIEQHTPFLQMQQAERQQLISRLIAALPEKQRMLIQLRDIEGESYEQIAKMLNASAGQVKTGLFRARQELKFQLDKMNAYGQI